MVSPMSGLHHSLPSSSSSSRPVVLGLAHHGRAPACSPAASPCGTRRPSSSHAVEQALGDGRAGQLAVARRRRRAGTPRSSSSSGSRSTISSLTRGGERAVGVVARRRCRPTCRRRSCGRSARARRRGRRSCTRSRGRRRPRRPRWRRSCARRTARRRRRGGRPRRRWRRRAMTLPAMMLLLGDERRRRRRAHDRAGRRTGPCRGSRWRRPRGAA